jgi:leucyl aminopeptidase
VSISFTVASSAPARARADVLAVPVTAGPTLGAGADAVSAGFPGSLETFMERAGFEGTPGQALFVPLEGATASALLVGLGEAADVTLDALRRAAALVAQRASGSARVATTLADAAPDGLERAAVGQAIVEGFLLGSYSFDEYRATKKATKIRSVSLLVGSGAAAVKKGAARGEVVAGAVAWARDMVNTPARELSPDQFAKAAQQLLRGKNVKVEVFDVAALKRQKLGGILGVGQGSKQPPRLVKMTYSPPRAKGSLALVGKGVVFDSGGLSLKTGAGMETMKTDMGGAAAVIAAMSALSGLGVTQKVVGYAPMVENMPSGDAIRPGDVLTFRNGKTAEVLNTDAEGRLILADALALAAEGKPDGIVDLATLTGACVVALGEKIAGLFAGDEAFGERVEDAAKRAGESMWPLPLPKEYRKMLDSEVADMKNISHGGYGGALTAGLFLQEFVADVPWVHLDIAGPARAGADDGYVRRGGTGFGVRTLLELASTAPAPKGR